MQILSVTGAKGQPLILPLAHPKCLATFTVPGKQGGTRVSRLAGASRDDGTVVIVDPRTMAIVGSPLIVGTKVQPAALCAVLNRYLFVSAPKSGHILAFEIATGQIISDIEFRDGADPKFIVSSGDVVVAPLHDKGLLCVWNAQSKSALPSIRVGDQPMDVAMVSPSKAYVALAGEHKIVLVDLQSGEVLETLTLEEYPQAVFMSVTYDASRGFLWAQFRVNNGALCDMIAVFDTTSGTLWRTFLGDDFGDAGQRVIDPRGNLVATCANALRIFSPDGNQLASREFYNSAANQEGFPYGLAADPLDPNRIYVGIKGHDVVAALEIVNEPEKIAA